MGTPDDMQNRIDRLEGLVLSLMTAGGSAGPGGSAAAAHAAIDASRRSQGFAAGDDMGLDMGGADIIVEEGEDGEGEAEESDVEQVSKGIGIMKVDQAGRAMYASDAHWYAILGELSEVKKYFEAHREDYARQVEKVRAAKADGSPGTTFLLQGPPTKTHGELLSSFPSKADSDRLIARYFNAYDPSIHIIHGPSFQRQYDNHWLNSGESSVVWLGMCFSMMTLALQSYDRAGDEPPEYQGRALQLSHEFRQLTAQCLILADITQPIPQVLETLLLHVQAEYGRSRDAEPGVLLMVSLCVRLAMRMGYHRDPAPHAQITPFQGEIRRRIWTFVRQCDLLISFQFGLPAMIRTDHIDTLPPRNIYDDELHEDASELPASRPSFEATPMSYMIAKSRMTFLFGRIVERAASIPDPPSYEETMRLDQELRETRATHPPLLQMRSFHESARDPANQIMQRLGLEMIYLRSLFVLHRRFIAKARENPRYAYSRRTCIDASMELLSHQATLRQESQPGGRLRSVKWYISSLTTHDFLLAAMLVCLDLYHTMESERKGSISGKGSLTAESSTASEDVPQQSENYRREEMLQAVEHCITIWDGLAESSMEAFKASAALRVMVEKLKAHRDHQQYASQLPSAQRANAERLHNHRGRGFPTFGAFPNGKFNDVSAGQGADAEDLLPPEQSAAMTLGMLSSGGLSPGQNFGLPHPAGSASMMESKPYSAAVANMGNMLGDDMQGRTGFTPGYSGLDANQAIAGAVSPFTQMFGQGGGLMNGDAFAGGDIDWVSLLTAQPHNSRSR